MNNSHLLAITLVNLTLLSNLHPCRAQESDVLKTKRAARHELFLKTVSELMIASGDVQLTPNRNSVLHYSNPVRGRYNDAETFVFTGRSDAPFVLVSTSLRGRGQLFLEAVSVSSTSLAGELPGFGEWKPQEGGSGKTPASIQPGNIKSDSRRLLIMRRIAGSMSVEFDNQQWKEARLLSQPLYRYSDADANIIDGAIFAFGESNDPEAFLHVWLETSKGDSEGRWYWLAAASTSLPLRVKQNEEVLWEKSGFWANPRPPESPYVESLIGTHPDLVDTASN